MADTPMKDRGLKVTASEILTVKETAALLRIGLSSLYRLIEKNQGPPALRLGRSIRFRRSTLEKFLDSQDGNTTDG